MFNLLEPRQLATWVNAGQELAFAVGETVMQEGSPGVWAYLILEGRVRILRRSEKGEEVTVGLAGRGEVFGEYALLPPHRNTATCRASEPVRLLRLQLLALQPLLKSITARGSRLKDWLRLHGLVGHLRGQAFLGFMSAPSALKFLEHLQAVDFPAQATIQAAGLGADRWYYVEKGQIRLAEATPRELGPGNCFGEPALLGRNDVPVAVALTDVHCLSLTRSAFAARPGRPMDSTSVQSLEPQQCTLLKTYPWVGQREEADCGIAALAMIARFHAREVSVEQLRGQIQVAGCGAPLSALQQGGTALGLRCLAVRVEPGRLDQVELPAIVHQSAGHYVVLYEMKIEGVVVGDPATGIVKLSRASFANTLSGNMLLVRP